MKSLPNIIELQTRSTIILNHFDSWEFISFDSVHEFPRTTVSSCNFLNFSVEKCIFSLFYNTSKDPPIFNSLCSYTSQVIFDTSYSTTISSALWYWQFLGVWTKFYLYYQWNLVLFIQDFPCLRCVLYLAL